MPLGFVPIEFGIQNNLTLLYPEYPFCPFPEHDSLYLIGIYTPSLQWGKFRCGVKWRYTSVADIGFVCGLARVTVSVSGQDEVDAL